MLDTVNVGFIGCGGNARGHMKRVLEIPHARLEALPAGHVPQLGNPDRVAALLEDFVTQT